MQIQVSLKIEISASANLTEMEQQIQESGQHMMREAFKQIIRKREEEQIQCPACGGKSYRLEGTTRRVIATVFGRVEVPRRRFRCQQCLHRWCPANRLFDSLKGGVISCPLQEAAMLAGCSWPYRVASRLLRQLSGAQISAEEIRLVLNRRGKHRAGQQQEEAERVCANPRAVAPSPDQGKPPILVGLDGGWVGSREQRGGMEGKVAVVSSQMQDLPMPTYSTTFSWSQRGGPRRAPKQRHRLASRKYVATFASSAQLGQQAEAAAQTLSQDASRPVVVVADGANWIKTEQARHFPQATCILDWAHLWREVSHAIRVAARAKSLSPQDRDALLSRHQSWLWYGNVDQAVQGMRTLATGLPPESRDVVQKAIPI